jgi:hypothetical protein
MKATRFYIIIIFIAVVSCTSKNQSNQNQTSQVPKVNEQNNKTLSASSINTIKISCNDIDLTNYQTRNTYTKYENETVQNQLGYGVYFKDAVVQLSRHTGKETQGILKLHYELSSDPPWSNWLSIRKEFINVMDATECKGLKFTIKVVKPTNAILRVTFCDAGENRDLNIHGADEMWWFDFKDVPLNKKGKWQTLYAPFDKFTLSYGIASRIHDGKMDISKFVAYEINIISEEGKYAKGDILIESLRIY